MYEATSPVVNPTARIAPALSTKYRVRFDIDPYPLLDYTDRPKTVVPNELQLAGTDGTKPALLLENILLALDRSGCKV
jgi:hypothetical protein